MSNGQRSRIHSVLGHEQPPGQALLNIVQPIARGCLRNLHPPNCGVAVQHQLQTWSGLQRILQGRNFYPKSVPRHLYYRPQRASAQANRRWSSAKALVANYPSFGRLAIFHYDHKRNQTSIQEIRKLQLCARFVKHQMVWQADVFEVWPK